MYRKSLPAPLPRISSPAESRAGCGAVVTISTGVAAIGVSRASARAAQPVGTSDKPKATYRASVALLIASTYGDPFDPETQQPPHILARNLDGASDIQAQLDRWVEAWHSPEDLTSDQALRRAFVDVGDSLTKALGHKH